MITSNLKGLAALPDESRLARIFMKNRVWCFAVCITYMLLSQSAAAQAPNISYSPSTNALTVGNAFSITPGNMGGAVPAGGFGAVSTFAGSTSASSGWVNGTGTAALFFNPDGVAIDPSGTYYVTEDMDVRKITSGAVVTSVAGAMDGSTGTTNGTGSAARFNIPSGIATDGAGNLYIADRSNNEIRKVVISTGAVTLLAGSTTGLSGTTNGTGTAARFNSPIGIVYNPVDGALYVTDSGNNQIRKVTTGGVVTLFAGNSAGTAGLTNGTGTAAAFNAPVGIAVDASGNFYVADQNNNEIRKVTSAGVVSLVAGSTTGATGTADGAGTAATFYNPTGVAVDPSGNLYVSERGGTIHDIRFISAAGQVVRVAGGTIGDIDGNGTAAAFNFPYLITFDATTGSLVIPDSHNRSIRKMSTYGWFISPALPSGLSFDNTTGTISGTPAAAFSATTYTVYAVNSSGASSTTITLSAAGLPPNISYSPSTNALAVGSAFTITPANTGGAVQGGSHDVTTYAGSTSGTSGTTNGPVTTALLNGPRNLWIDPVTGTMYVADGTNNQIRQITSAGVISLLAGNPGGLIGTANGTGTAASFNFPAGITGDGAGNLYISDSNNNEIRKIVISTGAVTLLAGSTTSLTGLTNGTGTAARFNLPKGIIYNPTDGALYVVDCNNNQIRKVTTAGVVTLFAGSTSGTAGRANGTGTTASFKNPDGIAIDASGNFFVTDATNCEIRKITSGAVVSLFAGSSTGGSGSANGTGTAATFLLPSGISVDAAGNLYVVDAGNNKIRLISSAAVVTTIDGNGTQGYIDGTALSAEFNQPRGAYLDASGANLYVADYGNNVIRRIGISGYTISPSLPSGLTFDNTTGTISGTPIGTFSSTIFTVMAYNQYGSSSTTITLSSSAGIPPNISYSPSTNVLTVSSAFSITPTNSGGTVPFSTIGLISTFAGSTAGTAGRTNATGTAALFNSPRGGAFDASGNVYIADNGNNEIRKITPAGVVTLLAGSTAGASGLTNGTGTGALFNFPIGIASDGAGNLYVTDFNNNEIRKIVISTGVVTLLAGSTTGAAGSANGTGSAATFTGPQGIVYNAAAGALYVTESNGNRVRKVTTAGVVTTLAGSGTGGSTNGTGIAAQFFSPRGIAADASGNLYVSDYGNNEIRKITTAGVVTLFAGSAAGAPGSANGTGSAATFNAPIAITADASGNLYVGDGSSGPNLIRAITPAGVVTTVAGTGSAGYVDGSGTIAQFNRMEGMEYNPTDGSVLIGDLFNNVIRKMSNYGYFITPTLPAGLSFDRTNGKISGTPTASFAAIVFTVTAYNPYGSSSTTITLSCTSTIDWKGTTNTDWATGSNWSTGTVPGSNDVARIGVVAYTGSQPTLSSGTSVYAVQFGKNSSPVLTIASGAILTGATNGIVVDVLASPTIKGPGTITIGPACASTIPSSASLTLSANAILTLGTNASLTNSGTFTLGSDASGSSSIATLPSGASISGIITVQRYVTGGVGHRGYRLLSSPVYAGTDSYSNKIYSINYLLNSTFLTGYGGTTGGFNQYGNPTLYVYRESLTNPSNSAFTTGNYRGINNISASPNYNLDIDGGPYNIPVGNGYLFFFRGGTATINPYTTTSTPVAATLAASGTLNQGTITVKNWFTPSAATLSYTAASPANVRGFNLLGNPYPCTINFEKFNRNGTNSTIYGSGLTTPATIYFFNPVTKQYCSYQQKITITSAADTTSSINPGTSSDGYASNMIASGEGFFIQATGTGQTFTFTENAKVTTQPSTTSLNELMSAGIITHPDVQGSKNLAGMPAASATQSDALLRLRLVTDSVNTDEVVLTFNNQNSIAYADNIDALDLGGNGALESLSLLSSDSVKLAIYRAPLPGKTRETIPLLVGATGSGRYQLKKIQLDNLPKLYHVWLQDAFMKDSLEITANDTYSFDIDKSNPATFGTNRFSLVIRQDPALGVPLLNFTAAKTTNGALIGWTTENEADYTGFAVERSNDNGASFVTLGVLFSNELGTYSFLDKTPPAATDQYRLKITDLNGAITYSKIVTLTYGKGNNSVIANVINVYPNPTSSMIDLSVVKNNLTTSASTASYKIIITNSSGSIVKTAVSTGATWEGNVSTFLPGTYLIQVLDRSDNSLVGKAKFIKI